MPEVHSLVCHRAQDVAGQGWIVGLCGELDGDGEILLRGRMLGVSNAIQPLRYASSPAVANRPRRISALAWAALSALATSDVKYCTTAVRACPPPRRWSIRVNICAISRIASRSPAPINRPLRAEREAPRRAIVSHQACGGTASAATE